MAWRYLAQRLTGDGKGEFIDMALPLAGVQIEDVLSGPGRISGAIAPEVMRLKGPDGRPLLEEWSTAIYAEKDGEIRGGGILVHSEFTGAEWRLDAMGFCGYAQGMPYTDSTFFVGADPADIFRHAWDHLQSQLGGNIGLVVDGTTTPLRLGTALDQIEYDTQNGPMRFESGPYKLTWYLTDDIGRALDDLAAQTPFEYLEEHTWKGETIEHRLRLGYPTVGVRRPELRFVIGENVSTVPTLERDGEDYANEILALGAGEGRDMVRATDARPDGRLRRVAVVTDKTARSPSAAQSLARQELALRQGIEGIADLSVRDHPHARIGSWRPGDEIRVQGKLGWIDLDAWCRVLSTTISPDDPSVAQLTIARSETISS